MAAKASKKQRVLVMKAASHKLAWCAVDQVHYSPSKYAARPPMPVASEASERAQLKLLSSVRPSFQPVMSRSGTAAASSHLSTPECMRRWKLVLKETVDYLHKRALTRSVHSAVMRHRGLQVHLHSAALRHRGLQKCFISGQALLVCWL